MLTQYAQKQWTREDGLPQNSVLAIDQTADGYLWIGTEQGLARFDGVRFVSVEFGEDSQPAGHIRTLLAEDCSLWIGTSTGLFFLSGQQRGEILTEAGDSINNVTSMLRDQSGTLWCSASSGLFRVRGGRAKVFKDANGRNVIVRSLTESSDGRLCATTRYAVCLEDGVFKKVVQLNEAVAPTVIRELSFDNLGYLWAGTNGSGVAHQGGKGVGHYQTANGLPHDWVQALLVDRSGGVWIGFGDGSVSRIDEHGIEVLSAEPGRSGVSTLAFFEDREGNLWIGFSGAGLVRLSALPFIPFSVDEGLQERFVQSVLEDQEGSIWIGTAGGGLHRLADGTITEFGADEGLTSDNVISLAEDRQGQLWVGTGGAGVFKREGERFVPVEGERTVVFALHEDDRGRIWAATIGGAEILEGERFRLFESLQGFNAPAISGGPDGELWFANASGGAVVLKEGEVTRLGRDQGFPGFATVALYHDKAGGIWIGSHLGGLIYRSGAGVFSITTAHGLCDNSVFSITESAAGLLWMSSNLGVFAVDKKQLEAVARGDLSEVDCRLYGAADGMRSNECNGGQQPAAWRDSNNRLWFATTDGVVRVDPWDLKPAEAPPVTIEELTSGSTRQAVLSEDQTLELGPELRDMEIRYTAMTLTASERVRFRYQLVGYEQDWVEVGTRRVAYFTNLSPRQYEFRVQAQVPGGQWSESGASITIKLIPRFYEKRWFHFLALCGLVSLVLAVHRGRVATVRRRALHLQQQVKERTSELAEVNRTLEQRIQDGIEALRESDRMAAYGHLVVGVAHEVRPPILALRTAAHLLAQELAGSGKVQEALDIMEHETERMNQVIDDLLELGRPRQLELAFCQPQELIGEALASIRSNRPEDLRFSSHADGSEPAVLADRPAIIQVLVNLLDNASRHAHGACKITAGAHLDSSTGMVHLTVTDDGQGISVVDQSRIFEPFYSGTGGTGLGLAIASRLIREHGGALSVESTKGVGTVFTVALSPAVR